MIECRLNSPKKALYNIFILLYPFLSFVFFVLMISVIFNTYRLPLRVAFYNIFLTLPVIGILLMISRRIHITLILSGILFFLIYYIDQCIYSSRLTHIRYSDLRLISQAFRVANRYHLPWNTEIIHHLLVMLILSVISSIIYHYYGLKYNKKSIFFIGFCVFSISSIAICFGMIPKGEKEAFNFNAYTEERGLLYSWYCQSLNSELNAPKGYSKQKAEAILGQYDVQKGIDNVRIIIIMNESLTDYSLIGTPRFADPLPYIHSLVKHGEAFEGKLAVSVYAGNTANTEFEFLTGNSTAFLPEGCTPYLQYVDHKINSIVRDLEYFDKIAIHPYYSEEWNRTQVYNFLGFDRFISGRDFGSGVDINGNNATELPNMNIIGFGDGPLYIRGLISDKSCFKRIQEENTDFSFSVTMQNHGAYTYSESDFENLEYVTIENREEWVGKYNLHGINFNEGIYSIKNELYQTNQYLTLTNLSDQAFQELINELKSSNIKTFVLMFGDHQPGIMIPEHYVNCEDTIDMDFIVPYIFWANYDIKFDAPEIVSTNFLSAVLKKNIGLTLTEWDQFRLDIMKDYPVITANFILNKDNKSVGRDTLMDYEYVQYMRMFE